MPTPYSVKCSECGNDLEITDRSMDAAGDVLCEALPCVTCKEEAYEDGYRQGEEDLL